MFSVASERNVLFRYDRIIVGTIRPVMLPRHFINHLKH